MVSPSRACAWSSSNRRFGKRTGHNPSWLGNLAKLTGKGWRDFSGKYRDDAKNLCTQIVEIGAATLLPIPSKMPWKQ